MKGVGVGAIVVVELVEGAGGGFSNLRGDNVIVKRSGVASRDEDGQKPVLDQRSRFKETLRVWLQAKYQKNPKDGLALIPM